LEIPRTVRAIRMVRTTDQGKDKRVPTVPTRALRISRTRGDLKTQLRQAILERMGQGLQDRRHLL
ncbi:MAG: hypothetical protein ACREN8_04340, partial [Candidatus Dormibacteraceae bacterium]